MSARGASLPTNRVARHGAAAWLGAGCLVAAGLIAPAQAWRRTSAAGLDRASARLDRIVASCEALRAAGGVGDWTREAGVATGVHLERLRVLAIQAGIAPGSIVSIDEQVVAPSGGNGHAWRRLVATCVFEPATIEGLGRLIELAARGGGAGAVGPADASPPVPAWTPSAIAVARLASRGRVPAPGESGGAVALRVRVTFEAVVRAWPGGDGSPDAGVSTREETLP